MEGAHSIMPNLTILAMSCALCFLLLTKSASAEPTACRPAVVVYGEPKLIKNIKVLLKKRGIEDTQVLKCPTILAKVERKDDKLVLWMQDSYGRTSERPISDAQSAATLLESWARTDLTDPLWAIDSAPEEPTTAPSSATVVIPQKKARVYADDPGPTKEDETPFSDEPRYKWWQTPDRGFVRLGDGLSVATEFSRGLDGTNAVGAKVTGCKLVGPICLGTLARAGTLTGPNQVYADVEGTFNIPMKFRQIWVTPGLGAGVGWMRKDSLFTDLFLVKDTLQTTINSSGGLRAEFLLHIVTPISPEFLFEIGGAFSQVITRGSGDNMFIGEIAIQGDTETFLRTFIGIRYKVR
jgi:hypothetical protein